MHLAVRAEAHVVSQKHDSGGAEMDCQVHGLMPGIAAGRQLRSVPLQAFDLAGFECHDTAIDGPLQRELQAGEGEGVGVLGPPAAVAGVESISPWRQAEGGVDDDQLGAAADLVELGRGE